MASLQLRPKVAAQQQPRRQRACTRVAAQQKTGFGETGTLRKQGTKKGKEKAVSKLLMSDRKPKRIVDAPQGKGWLQIARVDDFTPDRITKPIILANNTALVLYRVGQQVYCSAANSTAFQYPLVDAKVTPGPEGPIIETPLDGTQYNLRTGEVLLWCPKNNPLRAVLGTIKSAASPEPLKIYETAVTKTGEIFVKLE